MSDWSVSGLGSLEELDKLYANEVEDVINGDAGTVSFLGQWLLN